MAFRGIRPSAFNLLMKEVVSFKYDFIVAKNGLIKKSTNFDIFSVGQALAEIIGLPGGGFLP